MTMNSNDSLEGSYLSADDIYILVQLTDMAVTALERKDFAQLDLALSRISSLRNNYSKVRSLVGTLSKRRSLGPGVHLT